MRHRLLFAFRAREDSYDRLLDEDRLFAANDESVEDMVIRNMLIDKLYRCLEQLSDNERQLIQKLYFERKTQMELERETGVKQQTISYREKKIREKLKKMMEK